MFILSTENKFTGIYNVIIDQLKPLMDLLIFNMHTLYLSTIMYAHYYHWIAAFSEKIHSFAQVDSFPLSSTATEAFKGLKRDIGNSAIITIDPTILLVVEIYASDCAVTASLRQNGNPEPS